MDDKLISRNEAAEILGLSPGTLEVWACKKRYNLLYVKIGKLAKYRMSDVEQFIESRTVKMKG